MKATEAQRAPDFSAGWVLYDGSCGFCSWWLPLWEDTLNRRGFQIAPLQAGWVRERLSISDAELMEDLRLLLPDGTQLRGANVYRHVMRKIWWAWPIYCFSILPITSQIFDWGYRTFARNRYRVSKSCGLQPRD